MRGEHLSSKLLNRPRTRLSLSDTKCQVWHKMGPAAEGDPPRGRNYDSRKSFCCAKIFSRGLSKSICKLSARAQGNPACAMIREARGAVSPLPPSLREVARRSRDRRSNRAPAQMRGKRSSEHSGKAASEANGLRNLLRCDEAEGNPPRGRNYDSRKSFCCAKIFPRRKIVAILKGGCGRPLFLCGGAVHAREILDERGRMCYSFQEKITKGYSHVFQNS